MKKEHLILMSLLILGLAYMAWLDNGCELSGIMTWEGKYCINFVNAGN